MELNHFIFYLNCFVLISCLDVKLNVHQKNGSIINYTIINNTNTKEELFKAEKIFYSKCQCNYNTEVFFISPEKNLINFTINTTDSKNGLPNIKNEMTIKDPNLYVNSKKLDVEYTLNNINNQIYNLQINTICKMPKNRNNNRLLQTKTIKNYGIYKIESFSEDNHPDYNDNDNFAVLNFTFNYNKTNYNFSFIKMCFLDEKWKNILSCCCIMLIAFLYVYFSTFMKLNFKFVKEVQEASSDIKWYHICYSAIFGSILLVSIYLFKKYILIILNILIGFESWLCTYYAMLFFVLLIGKKYFSFIRHKELSHKKYRLLFDMTLYEIISAIISGFLIMFYFITRHWILNDIICFCLAFTSLSFIILKSYMLCFVCLFLFFIYDTFWVFYSKKIFKENVMVVAATSIQIPIKIEFPILFSNNPIKNCMLLGLGDILLPGVVIKYCRRFDSLRQKIEPNIKGMSFYTFNLILYFVSVALAMSMMFIFDHGQPVLFYISPIFIIGLMGKAYKNNCLVDFWKGLKIKKPKSKNKNVNNVNDKSKENEESKEEETDEEEEEEEDEDKNKNKKFVSKKIQQTELQKLNLNN